MEHLPFALEPDIRVVETLVCNSPQTFYDKLFAIKCYLLLDNVFCT
ncbi:Uncharacterised protein [uncultured archaeon]|nr:Uncharacterised protein [uncultured archaeon]